MAGKISNDELKKNYKRVNVPEEKEAADLPKNELRVGPLRPTKTYISQAIDLFTDEKEKTVIVKGRGKAVSSVVNIAEVVKRRVKGIHQLTEMESTEVVDVYEPKEGGDKIEQKKYICGLKVTLSLEPLDDKAAGYQAPIPEDEVTEEKKELRKSKGGKGNGGGGGGGGRGRPSSGARGGGRGGGKGGRGGAARGGGNRGAR